jgi:hypothetical protein
MAGVEVAEAGGRMTSDIPTGRLAGTLYLVVVVTGMFSLAYVPSHIAVGGDPAAAIDHIRASEPLFRLGIASFLINQVAFLLLPLALFKLLRPSGREAAVAMVALAWVSVAVALASVAHRMEALSLVKETAGALDPDQLKAAVASAISAYGEGMQVTSLFWGLWLAPFGYLVLKSRMLPKALGMLLILGCAGYLVDVFGTLLVPSYAGSSIGGYALLPAALGEIGTCLWLLIAGVRRPALD